VKRFLAATAIAIAAALAVPAAAQANVPITSDCVSGAYVSDDENGDGQPPSDTVDLRPTQTAEGFLFDGPSIVHFAVTPMALADVPTGHLTTVGDVTGSAPLFKMETSNGGSPVNGYSTINVTGSGSVWSSKIPASSLGGQSNPVEHVSELAGKWSGYTADTKVTTIGAGYANDPGNKATVSAIAWNGKTYDLTCQPGGDESSPATPKPSSATPKPSTSSSHPAGAIATTTPASGGAAAGLPVTGSRTAVVASIGALLLIAGAGAFVLARRRRMQFKA
jgi:LPXTG-motif cell wall-anchored protein